MIKCVFFDLDGTLLAMDQDAFTKKYFSLLAQTLAPYGYEPEEFVRGIWQGTKAMIKNDGARTNEAVFWETFAQIFGEKVYSQQDIFDDFYRTAFKGAAACCQPQAGAKELVQRLKDKGYRLVISSNPVFPLVGMEERLAWAGLNKSDFEFISSYENMHFSKPNPAYFSEIASKISLSPQEIVVIGNDVDEDMSASAAGFNVFLATCNLINKWQKDISVYPHGDFAAFEKWLENNANF